MIAPLPILVTGAHGQVGTELRRRAPARFEVVATDRTELDITDAAAIAAAVASRPWAAVVNCAAHTAVDKAESDVEASWRLNALAPAIFAAETRKAGIPIIQISTDYVFEGGGDRAYQPADPTGPRSVYGASKLGGELAVRTANPQHVVLRTAWVVSAHGNNFIKTMLRVGAERPQLRVVADQFGCPTGAPDIADGIYAVLDAIVAGKEPWGTYHLVNAGEGSWHTLAEAVFATAQPFGGPSPAVEAIGTSDYPTPARRPANSRLDTSSFIATFAHQPRPWRAMVAEVVGELLETKTA